MGYHQAYLINISLRSFIENSTNVALGVSFAMLAPYGFEGGPQ